LSLAAIHGRSPLDVYAVGLGGTVLHFDGVVWSALDAGTDASLEGVWCADDSAYVVGADGTILGGVSDEFGTTTWTTQSSSTVFSLFDVTGAGDGTIYASGYSGVVLRNEGNGWSVMDTGRFDRLNGISADPCGELHVAGLWGLVLHYQP